MVVGLLAVRRVTELWVRLLVKRLLLINLGRSNKAASEIGLLLVVCAVTKLFVEPFSM